MLFREQTKKMGYMQKRYSIPKVVSKNIHIIPKNLMKNGSFEFQNRYHFDNNILNNNLRKRRANSNKHNQSNFSDYINNCNNCKIMKTKISNRNTSNISNIISLKKTEIDEIMRGFNNFKKMNSLNKNSNKKKKMSLKKIKNYTKNSNKQKTNSHNSSINKRLKNQNSKYNSASIQNSLNISNKNNKCDEKNNTFNDGNKQKNNINCSYINKQYFSKYNEDKMNNTICILNSNKENFSSNIYINYENIQTKTINFGKNKSYKIPSEFVYIKKNNICYSNNNSNKSKNKSNNNSTAFSTGIEKQNKINQIQKSIDNINISEFRIEEDKESDINNSMTDVLDENNGVDEENITKINCSYIAKYKTIGQIEKKIENENAINRIINNNINKINYLKEIKNTREEYNSDILNTATFGLLETEKQN